MSRRNRRTSAPGRVRPRRGSGGRPIRFGRGSGGPVRAGAGTVTRPRTSLLTTSAWARVWATRRRCRRWPCRSVPGCAAWRPRSGVLPCVQHAGTAPARRIPAGDGHEPRHPAAQPSHPGIARQTREQARQLEEQTEGGGGGKEQEGSRDKELGRRRPGRCQAQGRRSHRDEVHVPREHEPRNPDADERDHRPLASRPQEPSSRRSSAITSARFTTPARRCCRSSTTFSTSPRSRPASSTSRQPISGSTKSSAPSPRSPRKRRTRRDSSSWCTSRRHAGAPARRSAPPRPDPDQLCQQRREVHRTRRSPDRHRTAGTHGREGATQVFRARHRHRHDARASRPNCSSRSRKPTCPRPANTAARAWVSPSAAGWSS